MDANLLDAPQDSVHKKTLAKYPALWSGHGVAPLSWREPRRVFVASDRVLKNLSDDAIDRLFAVMALCPQHTFMVLTKGVDRLHKWYGFSRRNIPVYNAAAELVESDFSCFPPTMARARSSGEGWWPLPNVQLGVSVEDQASADERIPLLLATPAAVRFVSAEPLLGPVRLDHVPIEDRKGVQFDALPRLHGVLVGGESGPGTRPCNVSWIRSIVQQCKDAGVACFCKQLGARPVVGRSSLLGFKATQLDPDHGYGDDLCLVRLRDPKGGDINEFPVDLRVRELPP